MPRHESDSPEMEKFLIIGLKLNCLKLDNSSLNTTHSARNLGFIFEENLTFSDQISSKSYKFSYSWAPLYPSLPWF